MGIEISAIFSVLQSLTFWPLLAITFACGMYFFWREAKLTGKDRNSTFDLFIISGLVAVIWGRVSYIASVWAIEYSTLPWFIYPYERYSDGLYIFRLLPWRFFRIWDGGVLFTGLFLGFFITAFLYSTFIKKWRWDQMMSSIVLSSNLMFGMTILFYGGLLNDQEVFYNGVNILLFAVGFVVLTFLVDTFLATKINLKRFVRGMVLVLFTFSSAFYLYNVFTSANISQWDTLNVQVYVLLTAIVSLIYLFSIRKESISIENVSSVRPISISANQSISVSGLKRRRDRLKGSDEE